MTSAHKNIAWAISSCLCILIWMTVVLLGIRSCNYTKMKNQDSSCSSGETREGVCPSGSSGRVIELCKDGKFEESFNSCAAGSCSETVFDRDLQPKIEQFCKSCHPTFANYDTAKVKIDDYIKRITSTDVGIRMPKNQPPLVQADIDIFSKWKKDGSLAACATEASNPHIDLNTLEEAALKDINSLNSGNQTETRWLYTAAKSNEGASKKTLAQFTAAIQKGINSVSLGRNLVLAKPVDSLGVLYRFNLNDLKLTVAAWNLIEAADPINFESNTTIGGVLKGLTKSKKPLMSVEAFVTAAMRADVYYAIRKVPSDLNTFLTQLGVSESVQIANFQALFLGLIGDISLNKQRLLSRFDSNDGALWQTFDTNSVAAVNKNLEQFPLLKATDPKNNYQFDASEILFALPNGLIGGALFAANGKRADFAPLDVVAHNVKPPADPTIKIQSCTLCHAGGMIQKSDTIRAKVDANAINFDLRDVDLVDLLYRNPEVYFTEDNGNFAVALAKLGILPSDQDPMSVALFSLQERNLSALSVASFLLLTEEEFKAGLARSVNARAQVGGLLSGGTITFEQFKAVLPILIRDLRLGQDPLNQ